LFSTTKTVKTTEPSSFSVTTVSEAVFRGFQPLEAPIVYRHWLIISKHWSIVSKHQVIVSKHWSVVSKQ
jgi:hypothetical protein